MKENPSPAGTAFIVGAFIVGAGALIWNATRRKAPAPPAGATGPLPPPPAPGPPVFVPTLPPTVPSGSLPPAVAPSGCQVTQASVALWAAARDQLVFWVDLSTPPTIEQLIGMVPAHQPTTARATAIVVTNDGAFWIFTGVLPVPAPAPAQRDDYCLWLSQQSGNV